MNKIDLFLYYEWNDKTIFIDEKEFALADFISIVNQLNKYYIERKVELNGDYLNVVMKEAKIPDFYYVIDDTKFIKSDINIILFMIENNLNPSEFEIIEYQNCTYLISDKYVIMHDFEYVRYGWWLTEEILNIDVDKNEIVKLNFNGEFAPNCIQYPDIPQLKNIVSLKGEGISNGFYKKGFKELKNIIKESIDNI